MFLTVSTVSITASCLLVAAFAAPVARADGCDGDPGFVLDMPGTAAIGTGVRICMQGPANEMALLMASLGQGPVNSVYGPICLDFPLLTSYLFTLDVDGTFCLDTTVPSDPLLIGTTIYAQFITCRPNRGISNQDDLLITDRIEVGDFVTFTQEGWGTHCEGDTPGCRRDQFFDQLFPGGLTVGDQDGDDEDDEFALTLTKSDATQLFLPSDGKPGPLLEDATDVADSPAGAFAGELAAARLNVVFDDQGAFDDLKGRPDLKLGDLIFVAGVNPDLLGLRVRDLLDICDLAISGALGEGDLDIDGDGDQDATMSDLSAALKALSGNFENGTIDRGGLAIG